jgi:hypothetical protein
MAVNALRIRRLQLIDGQIRHTNFRKEHSVEVSGSGGVEP